MPRHLLVLRHATAEPLRARDLERPLARGGHDEAQRIGTWLHRHDWRPAPIVASPARRARETAEHVCNALGIVADEIRLDDRLYENSAKALDAVLDEHAAAETLLLVGHNPGLEELLERLVGPTFRGTDGRLLSEGALAVVELLPAATQGQRARLRTLVRPSDAA